MLSLATTVKSIIKTETNCRTDSLISQLHYKATAGILLISCAIISSQQFFGTPIECLQDINGDDAIIPANVINSFCFITGTYTHRATPDGHLSSIRKGDTGSQVHAYYQWVPIVLFVQAVMFILPRLIWTQVEGGLLDGCLAAFDMRNSFPSEHIHHIPPLAKYLHRRINSLTVWGLWHIGHDILNFSNVIFNIYFIDVFLGRNFLSYGAKTSRYLLGLESMVSPMDDVFPKLTKCEFHKYGPSGSIQRHDVLCLMAMNIVNEKLYYFLWFWFIVVAMLTGIVLLLRLLKLLLLSARFRCATLRRLTTLYDESGASRVLLDNTSLTDIIFFEQLKANMNSKTFKLLVSTIADLLNAYAFDFGNEHSKLH